METLKLPKADQQRTSPQNRACHKYFDLMANELKKSGVTFSEYVRMRPKLEMHWTPHRVKELWKEACFHMYGHTSTAQMTTKQVNDVYDVVNKALGEITGVHIPFPSFETLIEEKYEPR